MHCYRQASLPRLTIVLHLVIASAVAAQTDAVGPTAPGDAKTESTEVVDPAGTWKWEYNFNGNRVEGKLHLAWDEKHLVGKYTAYDRTTEIEQAKLEKDQLSFVTKREFNGNQFVVTFSGQVKPDDITGKVAIDFGGDRAQEFEWHPKRAVEIDDVLGAWDLRVETPNGVVEPKLTISKDGDKLLGTSVSSVLGEREAKNLALKDNQLSWEIAGENDGLVFKIVYTGRPRGNTIEGSNEFEFAGNKGTMKFTGKRTPPEKEKQGVRPATDDAPAGAPDSAAK